MLGILVKYKVGSRNNMNVIFDVLIKRMMQAEPGRLENIQKQSET